MGNSSSKETSPAATQEQHEPRKPPRRKDSGGTAGQSLSRISTASATTSVGSGSSASYTSHTRGRSATLPTAQQTLQGIAEDDDQRRLSSQASSTRRPGSGDSHTPNRSRSPRPPLHVETTTSSRDPELSSTDSATNPASNDASLLSYIPSSQFARPPRLPLPIEEEIHAPDSPLPGTPSTGSPAIVPEDFKPTQEQQEDLATSDEDKISRTKSVLSSTTVDEDEDVEDIMYKAEDMKGPLVDTTLEWREGGSKVYVTGTFCGWVKKSRLHQHPSQPNVFSATIGLPPGTHHVTFFIDGVPRTARHLPTAVDYAGSLVNWIDVAAEETPPPPKQAEANKPQQQQKQQQKQQQTQSQDQQKQKQHAIASPRSGQPIGAPPSTTIPPPTPELKPTGTPGKGPSATTTSGVPSRSLSQKGPKTIGANLTRKHEEKKKYHAEIPRFLLDYDATEDSYRAERAEAVMNTQPAPPTLPMFLTKSVLTTQTPMKDDASVLSYPNHTTLNHLMTCNIKDAVLAVSATTRYKSKFVTTITFRPVDDDEDEDEDEVQAA